MEEYLSLDDAFASGELRVDGPPGAEALLVLGDSAGRIVHVADVPRGATCGCFCPACGGPLIARHGEVRVWHFAHESREQCDAAGAIGAAMRGFARQALEDGHVLRLPALTVPIGGCETTAVRGRSLAFDQVRIEERAGVAELVLTKGGRDLLVEFATRRRMRKKREVAIRDAGRSAIEIDLTSVVEEKDAAAIRQAILASAPRRWIFNSQAEQVRQQLEIEHERLELQRKRAEGTRLRVESARRGHRGNASVRAGKVFSYYASSPLPRPPAAPSSEAWAATLLVAANSPAEPPASLGSLSEDVRPMLGARGMADFTGVLIPGHGAFAVEPGYWQGRVLLGLIHAHTEREVRPEDICLGWLEIRALLRPAYRRFEEAGAPALDELALRLPQDAWPARRAIELYLSFLEERGIIARGRAGFRATKLAVELWTRTTR